MRFSWSTHLVMCLSLETLNHKDWLIYSVGTDMTGELCYTFSISNKLTQMVNFPTWIPGCFSVLLYWIYFFLLMLVFALPWFSFIGKLSSCCCLSFHWLFIKFTMGCPVSSHSLWLFSCWLGWSSWSFKFCEWVWVGIDVYIHHKKYQVKPHSSPWFFSFLCCSHSS